MDGYGKIGVAIGKNELRVFGRDSAGVQRRGSAAMRLGVIRDQGVCLICSFIRADNGFQQSSWAVEACPAE